MPPEPSRPATKTGKNHRGRRAAANTSPRPGAAEGTSTAASTEATPRPARKQQIIQRAVELMEEKGFLGTSIQDVADQLDFTKAAFYYFVKNKEELLYEIMQQAMDLSLRSMDTTAHADLPPADKLARMIEGYVSMLAERGDLMAILFQEKRHLSPEHYAAITRIEQQILEAWKDVYRAGVEDGSFIDISPTVAAFAVVGMCSWTQRWFKPAGPLTVAEVSDMLQRIVLHGVVRQPALPASAPITRPRAGRKAPPKAQRRDPST